MLSDVKRTIRQLRKVKKNLRVGSPERKAVNKKLKELKQQHSVTVTPDSTKQRLIDALNAHYNMYGKPVLVDFRDFTTEQLVLHLAKLKDKK